MSDSIRVVWGWGEGGLGLGGGTVKALKPRGEAVGHPPWAQAAAGPGLHFVEPRVQASRETFLVGLGCGFLGFRGCWGQ